MYSLETDFTEQVNSIIAENAMLHQSLDIQRMIQAGVNSELLKFRDVNTNMRRILAYIVLQSGGSYRLTHKTLMSNDHLVNEIDLDVDPVTNDWVLSLKPKADKAETTVVK